MTSPQRLEDELAATNRQLKALTDEVARNDEKMRRTQRRELRLLQAESLDVLITALTGCEAPPPAKKAKAPMLRATTHQIPLDAEAPNRIETATFGLG